MSQTVITVAFEHYKAQQEANLTPVVLDEFVLANVPNQDASLPIDRHEGLPPQAQIVLVSDVSKAGYVNPNAVVYSLLMDTTIGDFDFNWIGLRNKASGVVAAISHIPTVYKLKTMLGVQNGNSVTRSIMMSYRDAMGLTNIDVDASTWQIDFTARLFGIDDAGRLANFDVFGQAAFLANGFKVEKSGSDYIAKAGRGYVGGLRCHTPANLPLANVTNSSGIYLDASWQGLLTSQWQAVFDVKASASALVDYVDGNGYQHYVTKIADVDGAGNITDCRVIEGFSEYYQQTEVDNLLNEKINKASITDSVTSASSILVASAKGLKTAYDKAVAAYNLANSKWTHRAASTNQTGTSQLSDAVTSTSSVLSATAKAAKKAYDKGVEALNKANSKWTYVVATTSVYGATKLSIATNSTSTSLAATASAVKSAYDKAVSAYNLAASKMTQSTADSRYIRSFQVEDGDGTEVTIKQAKELKFVEGGNIDINFTDTSTGSDSDPFDLKFTVPNASTSGRGAVQLTTSTASTSTSLAAAASAVKAAYDKAVSAYSKAEQALSAEVPLYKGSRSTNGTWTISGLTVGKPLYLIVDGGSSDVGFMPVRIESGAAYQEHKYYSRIGTGSAPQDNNLSTTIIPTSTTLVISISGMAGTAVTRAYQ
ncbi:phage tail protein [Moritella sp.]|uniref:phage tail-collar fiber domain-containing protein n=1 Tax=Moritella sp. TaxID=78556 RepID=UPI0025DE13B3|nr:phage tail protein [Moritella sp.]MCJ8348310.1 phage tail protein [Moritella sp.]